MTSTFSNIETSTPRMNPLIPDSIGGLLAEELTINPTSTLPSFLEQMMIIEATKSGYQTLRLAMDILGAKLSSLQLNNSEEENVSSFTNENTTLSKTIQFLSICRRQIRQYTIRSANFIGNEVIQKYGPEIRFLCLYYLERRSICSSSNNATIAETLYGGKRVKVQSDSGKLHPMTHRDEIRLAFLISFGSYLNERSDTMYEKLLDMISNISWKYRYTEPTITTTCHKLKTILKVAYPLLQLTQKATFWYYQWKYLLGQSIYFDPYSQFLNLVLRRVTLDDQPKQPQSSLKSTVPNRLKSETKINDGTTAETMNSWNLRDLLPLGTKRLTHKAAIGAMSTFIILSWLAQVRTIQQQLLHQQRQEQEAGSGTSERNYPSTNIFAGTSNNDSKLIPPPPPPPPPPEPKSTPSDSGIATVSIQNVTSKVCPICQEPRINPTATTGGYVFCYKCILHFVRDYGICPISHKKCLESNLIRLYEPVT